MPSLLPIIASDQRPQDKADDVSRLPVAGVEQVGQGVGREVGKAVGAVEGVVQPPPAPPFRLEDVDRVQLLRIDHSRLNAVLRRPADEPRVIAQRPAAATTAFINRRQK